MRRLGSAQTRQGQALDLIHKVKGLGPLRVGQSPTLFERRFLQFFVFLAALVPVYAGLAGVALGVSLLANASPGSDLDSHFRYLSGLLLAIGLTFWVMIPSIERHGTMFRLLAGLVVLGGVGRLVGVFLVGPPSRRMLLTLVMELVVTPLLCLWQARVAALAVANAVPRMLRTDLPAR